MSKGLEALDILWYAKQECSPSCNNMCDKCQKMSAKLTIEKELKVLEIIKRNPTHIYNAFCKFPTYFAYKDYCEKTTIYKVTQYIKSQEEWDLVKEALL